VDLNPGTVYWMDVSDAGYYIHKKNENKDCPIGHTKKILFKKILKYYQFSLSLRCKQIENLRRV
jgi:hypothetical protein